MLPSTPSVGILICLLLSVAQATEGIIGCGGFVEHAPNIANIITKQIDYSLIQVKLLTTEGVIKETTECAPNGYYFIPIERKGNYIIQIEGPKGWTFDPTEVPVQIGSDNECHPQKGGAASGQDINFYFTGFSISGRVVGENCPKVYSSSGRLRGTRGVGITLQSLDKPDSPKTYTETDTSGAYHFSNVFPGRYVLTASHSSLHLTKSSTEVVMEWDNLIVPTDFLISGYPISGLVQSGNDPVANVQFVLYSKQQQRIPHCTLPAQTQPTDAGYPVCLTQSDKSGNFNFPDIPCGNYVLVPHYSGNNTSFDVSPAQVEVNVTIEAVNISPAFRVVGFSILGKVVDGQGQGMSQVEIFVDDQSRTVTDERGDFKLDQMKAGNIRIQAKKSHYNFLESQLKVVPNVKLPEITPSQYDICGSIVLSQGGDRTNKVVLKDENSREIRSETFTGSAFCLKNVSPGVYQVEPVLTSSEKSAGIMLTPTSAKVKVSHAPVFGVTFSQSRLTVSGHVSCLNGCAPSTVVYFVDSNRKERTSFLENGEFAFKEVVPGNYRVFVKTEEPLCWTEKEKQIEVKAENMTGVDFVQNGYLVQVESKHSLDLVVSQGSQVSTHSIDAPSDEFCLPKAGVYDVRPVSCFQFEKDMFSYDTGSAKTLTLIPHKYKIIGHIRIKQPPSDIHIQLKVTRGGVSNTVPVSLSELSGEGEYGIYEYSHWASLGDTLQVEPVGSGLLFYPGSRVVHVSRDECPPPVPSMEGRPALYKTGRIVPAVPQVTVVAVQPDGSQAVETLTDKNGQYSLGPLYDTVQYSVRAEKLGYNIEAVGNSGDFQAYKLSHVVVSVMEGNQGVAGVLISMSGANFRSNNVTAASGKFTFYGLKPGKYFARPLLKEYTFEPSSQAIEVVDGKDLDVVFKAKRNAFSCYGNLTSLTGEVIAHAVVEAVGTKGEYEEGESDQFGRYRIRGLLPGVGYTVRVKNSESGPAVERSIPAAHSVQVSAANAENVNFLLFHRAEHHSLTGVIQTEGDWLSSLVVTLSGMNDPENVLHRVSMGPTEFFRVGGLNKGRYLVKVYSTFPTEFYSLPTLQQSVEIHGDPHKDHITLAWLPTEHNQDVASLNTINTPIFGLLFGLLVLYCVFNTKKVLVIIQKIRQGSLFEKSVSNEGGVADWIPANLRQPKQKRK